MSLSTNESDLVFDGCSVNINNLGGIGEANITLETGTSILAGENTTNRSSFLHALAASLGADEMAATLKTDVDSGHVHLNLGDETYTREYERTHGGVQKTGSPYSDKPELVDPFVSLFADNPARRAVKYDDNIREIFMRPVDTVEIRSQIAELRDERSTLEKRIDDIREREQQLPKLEEERQQLDDELEEVTSRIEEIELEIEEAEETEDELSEEAAEIRDELMTLRSELGDVEGQIEKSEQKIEYRQSEREQLDAERETVESELAELGSSEGWEQDPEELTTEIEQLKDRRKEIEAAVEDLHSVIRINEELLDDDLDVVNKQRDTDPASALDPESEAIECWTCGTRVDRGQITDRTETLRNVMQNHRTELTELDNRVDELQAKKREYESQLEQRKSLQERLEEISEQDGLHAERIEELETERDELQAEREKIENQLAEVEDQLAAIDTEETDGNEHEGTKAHQQLSKLERRRGRLENQLKEKTEKIEEVENLSGQRKTYEQDISDVKGELADLRGKIAELEEEVVETLNTMMEDLVDILQYRNITRIWVERKTTDENDTESEFDLHVVRETDDGTVYEDSVDTLSESEREVLGLMIAFTGYLVHDVAEEVPFLLVDSVEMIDGERLAQVLNYIIKKSDVKFLLVALLPKDAQAVQDAGILSDVVTLHSQEVGLTSSTSESASRRP